MENSIPTLPSEIPWKSILIGFLVAGVAGLVAWLITTKANTRPLVQGFAPATHGNTAFPCSAMSSEASQLYSIFSDRNLSIGEEGSTDLYDLKQLLSKLCCMKQDIMGLENNISAVKELQFNTYQDIQPVADMTARCFRSSVPERELSIQFDKWHKSGKDTIRRLCTAGNISESEHSTADTLLNTVIKDAYEVARLRCVSAPVDPKFKTGPHDPAPRTPETTTLLRDYDGLY
jgi:hypothetical protein